jgi:ribosome-associated protein
VGSHQPSGRSSRALDHDGTPAGPAAWSVSQPGDLLRPKTRCGRAIRGGPANRGRTVGARPGENDRMTDVPVGEGGTRLGQFLKLADAVDTGGEAKIRIAYGEVLVNGEVETRRGRQVYPGDVVELGGATYRVV